jgi:excinuclease ABC subunit B
LKKVGHQILLELVQPDLNIKEASKKDLVKISKNIEHEMKLAADLLEFELAARLRDELKELRREIQEIVE